MCQSRLCSAHLEASLGPRTEGVPINNHRGRRPRPCFLRGGLYKSRQIVPIVLLVRVQRFMKNLYKVVKLSSTRVIVLSRISASYIRRWGRLTIFKPDKTIFAVFLPSFVCKLDHRRRPSERFVQIYTLETIFHQIGIKAESVTWRTFQFFFWSL